LEGVGATPVVWYLDGNGDFTRQMSMLISKHNCGMGMRSWRYAMVVNKGIIEKLFVEPDKQDNSEKDPYSTTNPKEVIEYLEKRMVEDTIGSEVRDAVSSGYDAY
jgi:peroxiredoxin